MTYNNKSIYNISHKSPFISYSFVRSALSKSQIVKEKRNNNSLLVQLEDERTPATEYKFSDSDPTCECYGCLFGLSQLP